MPEQLKAVENSHKAKGYPESPLTHEHICYHFFIGTDGTSKQVRGIEERQGKAGGCTMNALANGKSIQIVVAGDFRTEKPSARQMSSLSSLVERLQKAYGIPRGNIRGHRDASKSACPGENLYKLLPNS